MADMVEMAMKLIKQQDKILKEGDSVTEALTMRVGAGCSTVLNSSLNLNFKFPDKFWFVYDGDSQQLY